MGKSAKERNAEQLRELRNQERRRALEKKQKEQKIITIISNDDLFPKSSPLFRIVEQLIIMIHLSNMGFHLK